MQPTPTARTFLVAGGNTGIAAATVAKLDAEGHKVVCAARQPDAVATGPDVTAQVFDATDSTASLDLPEALDGVVYAPGTINLKPFGQLSDEDFLHDLQVNLLGAVHLIRQALPALKNSSSESPGIVLFSTVAVQTGMSFHASIASAKGAIEGLARCLAAEFAPKIRVNVIALSLTDTPLAARLLDSDTKLDAARQRHPLRRVGDPDDVAAAVSFLLQDHASFMTGQLLKLDGGLSSVKLF